MGFFRRRGDGAETSVPALVVEYWQGRETPHASFGETKTVSTRFTAMVRLEGAADIVEVSGKLPFWVGWLIVEGDTITVLTDAVTGRPTDFDRAELERQMTLRMNVYDAESKRRSSLRYEFREAGFSKEEFRNAKESAKALGKLPRMWKDAVFEKPHPGGGLSDDDPLLQPIDGVDFDTWVGVQADIVRQKVAKRDYDDLAQRRGVPPGRWEEIESAWRQRLKGNPGLAQRFGEAYQAALHA